MSITALKKIIVEHYRKDETEVARNLLAQASLPAEILNNAQNLATKWIGEIRRQRTSSGGIDAFLMQYDLSTEEGIVLMCIAEALLRIPDKKTRDALIQDKITMANWQQHVGQSESLFVNAATYGLMLTGKLFQNEEKASNFVTQTFYKFLSKSGEPIVRQSLVTAMKILGKQFVMGETIKDALKRSKDFEKRGYLFSYDMLGEAAKTEKDAKHYMSAYVKAIEAIAKYRQVAGEIKGPGISVKLSALYPRYEEHKKEQVFAVLYPRLLELALLARQHNVGFTIDAEESYRLHISLELLEALILEPKLRGYEGLGLAVQAYQKRALPTINWLIELARQENVKICVRLVKGAYWDSEIKWSQEKGYSDYPVFTRKVSTDVSYLACVKRLFEAQDVIYPMFATHNALTTAVVCVLGEGKKYEFQCLWGMGETLYDQILQSIKDTPARIYAPVGGYKHLLAYLVRRLLENGANTSFVNRILDDQANINDLVADPCLLLRQQTQIPHPKIPLPVNLYGDYRENSRGIDVTNPEELNVLYNGLQNAAAKLYHAAPTAALDLKENVQPICGPTFPSLKLGEVALADEAIAQDAVIMADKAFATWEKTTPAYRANLLRKTAELFERDREILISLLVREGGKTIPDAISELREAIDFCYYYAKRAEIDLSLPTALPGPTGEKNEFYLAPRGVIACISPWNFPLAIFAGQVTAGLAAGNCVIAKPASQTPLVAAKAVALMHEAGFPLEVVQLLPGAARKVAPTLLEDSRVRGVMFTGSTDTGLSINRTLAARNGAIATLIAETGGQNTMIVDSSALSEQVVEDVVASAFNSAGQRCSALRILFLQEEIADQMLEMLMGYMETLVVGDPGHLSTDVGPVIDKNAQSGLLQHIERMKSEAKLLYHTPLPAVQEGYFVAPHLFEIPSVSLLKEEVFGPVLHVVRFAAKDLDKVIDEINHLGFGLTLGIHSRINHTVEKIIANVKVGNIYVNRNMIGAVVGVQPFGGEGLSGTGPKAGGPHYLHRLCVERTVSINTTAAGGNASLMAAID